MKMSHPAVKNVRKNGGRVVGNARERRLHHPSLGNNDFSHLMAESSRDVTERQLAEEALQMEKNKLECVIDAMTDSLTILNRDFDITFQNERSRASSGDHLGEKCYRAYEHRDKVCEGCPVAMAFRDGRSHTSERKSLLPPGEVSFWENTANPVRDVSGNVVMCLEIGHEVTERKNAEKALQESQKFASSLLENAPHATVVINPDTSVRYVNPAWEHLNGWSLAEVVGLKAPYPWWPKDFGQDFLPLYMDALRQPVGKGEISALKKNGEPYWIDMNWSSVTQDGEFQYAIVNSVDITERKSAEEKRQAILQTALDGFCSTSLDGKFLEVNDSYCSMIGYTREELLKMSISEVDAASSPARLEELAKTIVNQGYLRLETKHRCKDGRLIDIEISSNLPKTGEAQVYSFVRDITERKKAEAKLQAQKQLIESILATMLEGVLVVDATDRVILANESALRIFHRSNKAIKNKLLKDIIPVEPLLNLYRRARLGKKEDNTLEFMYRVNDIDKIIACGAVRMDEGRTLLTFTDVSREREEKEKLYLTDRLASIGEMAVGLAHELNNPLTGILSLSQLLIDSDITPESKEDLQCINSEARRAANIVKNVLLFTRNNNYENGQASVNEVVRDVLRLREYEEKANNISVVTNLREDLPDVQIDRFQLQQVFLNIILNAETAIKEAGRPGLLTVTTEKSNHHVNIIFGDNGCGIKKKVLPRIFDPFFTTKEIGKGTGLGLSICFGIVSQHRGKISVRTQVNKGTTFIVRMPAVLK